MGLIVHSTISSPLAGATSRTRISLRAGSRGSYCAGQQAVMCEDMIFPWRLLRTNAHKKVTVQIPKGCDELWLNLSSRLTRLKMRCADDTPPTRRLKLSRLFPTNRASCYATTTFNLAGHDKQAQAIGESLLLVVNTLLYRWHEPNA